MRQSLYPPLPPLKTLKSLFRITLVSSLLTVVMAFDTSVPVPMRSMCATPNIVLVNIMACRVYRRTKAGIFRELQISSAGKNRTAPVISIHTNRTRTSDGPPFRVDIELATVSSPTANGGVSESNSVYKMDDNAERKEYASSFGEVK